MKYFEDFVNNGEWDDVEKYLSGFTKVDDNRYSMKIFFEIRKQKYLEALDKRDRAKAVEILVKDLKVFSACNDELFKEITQLLTLENFRSIMLTEFKKLIEANPLFRDKLQFPTLKNSRLRTLINQSLNWQHQLCKNPRSNPDIKTLFVDHSCGPPNGARAPSPVTNQLMAMPKPSGGFPPLGAHGPSQPAPAPLATSLAGWMANPSTVPHPAASGGPISLGAPNNADSEHLMKRSRLLGMSDEANNLPVNIIPMIYTGQNNAQSLYSSDELPKNVVMTLNQGSAVRSMDFHPGQPTLLLVGTNVGYIAIWELGSRERLALRNFKVWDIGTCSGPLQTAFVKEPAICVNRVAWSPDGALFGVAYTKHIVHVYSYHSSDDIRHHLEAFLMRN
ncbi:Topless-like [Thalictrum thalictroides]|uniref:Topless-like n=1 Tax=Thalictrum thalictroides TaxID=46969 RepID=A0A7J6UY06_THATH|nr:Topless-like [Thalictrum thalictroides]